MPERHAPGQPVLHATACLHRRRCSPAGRCLARTSQAHHGRQSGLSAQPGCRVPRALQPAAREQMPAPAAQPCTGQVADQIANTPRNTRMHPPRFCYPYCMISPIRGNRTTFRVQVPPRTHKGLPTELPVSYRQNSGGGLVFGMAPGSGTGSDQFLARLGVPAGLLRVLRAAWAWLTCGAGVSMWRGLVVPVSRRGASPGGWPGVGVPAG